MGYRPEEFDAAFAKVSDKYPAARRSVAEQVLGHLESFVIKNDRAVQTEKRTFRQLIQEALEEANVKGELGQKPYKSMIGFIYGSHGNHVKKRYREDSKNRPPTPRFPNEGRAPTVTENLNGQLRWQF